MESNVQQTLFKTLQKKQTCKHFIDSLESQEVIDEWKIIGYCDILKRNLTKGCCEVCKETGKSEK